MSLSMAPPKSLCEFHLFNESHDTNLFTVLAPTWSQLASHKSANQVLQIRLIRILGDGYIFFKGGKIAGDSGFMLGPCLIIYLHGRQVLGSTWPASSVLSTCGYLLCYFCFHKRKYSNWKADLDTFQLTFTLSPPMAIQLAVSCVFLCVFSSK